MNGFLLFLLSFFQWHAAMTQVHAAILSSQAVVAPPLGPASPPLCSAQCCQIHLLKHLFHQITPHFMASHCSVDQFQTCLKMKSLQIQAQSSSYAPDRTHFSPSSVKLAWFCPKPALDLCTEFYLVLGISACHA